MSVKTTKHQPVHPHNGGHPGHPGHSRPMRQVGLCQDQATVGLDCSIVNTMTSDLFSSPPPLSQVSSQTSIKLPTPRPPPPLSKKNPFLLTHREDILETTFYIALLRRLMKIMGAPLSPQLHTSKNRRWNPFPQKFNNNNNNNNNKNNK